ncbi:MAG TPA: helix-turn-helix domain-containing protein, partial [Acidobacteriota bacterium]|nr:helix-turn-helix domain-containing protein [Acidobacteriota bacterium]
YYRINVVAIHLPPLRERADDIPLLAEHFLRYYSVENGKSISAISEKAMVLLCSYAWPGNIRELENTIEQAVALSNQAVLTPEDLPHDVREQGATRFSPTGLEDGQFLFSDTPSLEEVKRRYVLQVLRQTQGNVSATARILNVDRRSLYRMLARYKVEPFLKDD